MHNNESSGDLSRSSRRGKFHTAKYSPNEVRTHCVSVRLNEEELSILNSKRGPYKKGEWLRMASLHKLPSVLPEINREAWIELGRFAQDLNYLLTHLDHKSPDSELTRTELFAVRRQIKALREHLIPSTFWSGNK
ncbi:ATP-binding protein [Salmonella enterica]|nr:ATP-binding protein [Salmonella enterica]EAO0049786.1 ATP-binding protein [Salmonella enterica]EAO9827749.1 ATP-binding protein [Salmonella enterica]EBC6997995.1 ATP-binding protein [Salmonella enterica]EEO6104560.1 ATP-binding protein [Salmonella enterica]